MLLGASGHFIGAVYSLQYMLAVEHVSRGSKVTGTETGLRIVSCRIGKRECDG